MGCCFQSTEEDLTMAALLEGKVAIVTGAGRGLGRTHALALAAAGASVVVNDLDESQGNGDPTPAANVVAEIRGLGGTAVANGDSVAGWDSARAAIQSAIDGFGRLDILVNNAGVLRLGNLDEGSPADWDLTIAVNLTGSAAMTYWAAQHWKSIGPAAGRAIINTTSPAGTSPAAGSAAYCVSKAGVIALTITSADELSHLGVRVNAIAPLARTRMSASIPMIDDILRKPEHGFDRMAPERSSPLVAYLASSRCRFTGRVIGIEGDNVCLFNGFSAGQPSNNGEEQWTVEALTSTFAAAEMQDHPSILVPGGRMERGQPSTDTLAALASLA